MGMLGRANIWKDMREAVSKRQNDILSEPETTDCVMNSCRRGIKTERNTKEQESEGKISVLKSWSHVVNCFAGEIIRKA